MNEYKHRFLSKRIKIWYMSSMWPIRNNYLKMKYRIAKAVDSKYIVELHYNIRETYSIGVFSLLGKSFLKRYYKIILNDPNSVVVCAEDEFGVIQGFCSATLDVEAQLDNIKKQKI